MNLSIEIIVTNELNLPVTSYCVGRMQVVNIIRCYVRENLGKL